MIIVSLTTIPPRMPHLHVTLDSILSQTIIPDAIVINIPTKYNNYSNDFSIPDTILNKERVIINRCQDYGPGTKLLGLYQTDIYNTLVDTDIIVIVDDDRTYNQHLISNFIDYRKEFPDNVLTVAGWEINALTKNKLKYSSSKVPRGIEFRKSGFIDILGGCCGFSLTKKQCPFNRQEIFDLNPADISYYVDDIWFSGFITLNNCDIMLVPNSIQRDEQRNINNNISELASPDRMNQNAKSIQYFIDNYKIWSMPNYTI